MVVVTAVGLAALLVGFGALLVPMEAPGGPCGTVWVPIEPAPAACGPLLGNLARATLVIIPSSILLLTFSASWSARLLERFLPWPPG